jgi:hypothetical protein
MLEVRFPQNITKFSPRKITAFSTAASVRLPDIFRLSRHPVLQIDASAGQCGAEAFLFGAHHC